MRPNPLIVRLIVVLMLAQQTLIVSAARRDNHTAANWPHAGSVYVDTQHHTRVLRVTDENDAHAANVISTTSFNMDVTRFVVSLDGVATLYRFDAASMNLLKEGPLTDGQGPGNDSLQWSAVEADTIFGLDTTDGAARLVAYDVVSRRGHAVKDFSAQLGRGEVGQLAKSKASDERFAFAWREAGQSAWRAVIVWDRAADRLYTFDLSDAASGVANFTNARFNESAEALVINGATTRVWRFADQSPRDAVQLAPEATASVSEQSAAREPLTAAAEASNNWPQERLSRDGRFALFSGGNATRQDVFLAMVPQAVASTLQWTNLVNSTAYNNSVQKTAGQNNADDASATSLQSVPSGDAYVEFTAIDTDKERVCGLSNSNAIHSSTGDINFAIRLNNARKAFVMENGATRLKVKYKPRNVFRIAIESGVVNYYRNGELIYTSQSRPAYPMLVTASLVDTMSSVDNVMVSGAGFIPVVSLSPTSATLDAGQTQQFKAVVTSLQIMGMSWSTDGGTITSNGLYTAPATGGTYTVRATLAADTPITATATVYVKGAGDTKPPVISAVAASGVTTSAASITWTTDEASDTQVEYGTSTAYGSSSTLNTAKLTAHSVSLSGLVAGTTYHYRVKSRDAANNLATSSDYTFTTTAASGGGGGTPTAPVISVLSTGSLTTNGAIVTWTTDKASDTQVEYGTSASYDSTTALNSIQVTAHSATLTGLVAGTVYHFRVKSRDASSNLVTSGDQTFMTGSTATSGSTGSSGTDPLKTDKNVYPEPAPPALPAAGGTLVDPTFGTTILRVTDERDGASNYNNYSYWPSLNRNNTRLLIAVNNGYPTLYDFDPVSFRVSNKHAAFSAPLPGGGGPQTEDAIWSGTDPDVIYCHSGMKLFAYNVVSNSYTLVKDFTGQAPGANVWQMSKSIDDNAFGFTLKDANWNVIGYMAWQRAQNNLYTAQTSQVDEVQIDKSGQYLTVLTGNQGAASTIETKIVNLQTRSVADLTDGAPDFAPGHHDSGSGVVIGNDNWNNALNSRTLANPHQFFNVLSMGNDWSQSNHMSLLGDGDAWVLVSMFVANTLPSTGLFKNELVLVATDGSQRVRRVAHHHSVYRDYWDTPRADISRDGQFAVFTSNWGSTTRRDVFVVKIPPPASGGGGDTTAPVISAVAGASVTATAATINWATNEGGDTQVEYGTSTAYGSSSTLNTAKLTAHSVSLSGLVAGTTYHYRVKSRDAAGNLATSVDMVLTPPGAASSSGGGGGGGGTGGGGTGGTSQSVVWTGLVNCTANGSALQKTGGRDDSADAGGRSQQSLTSGDGYLQFTAQETNKLRFCGLARNPLVPDFTGIDFAIKLTDTGVAEVREANVYKSETPFASGDTFRIAIEGGVVKYYKNGTVFYASTRAVSYPLAAEASFIALSGSFANVVMAATTGTLAMSNAPSVAPAAMTLAAMPVGGGRGLAWREESFDDWLVVAGRRRRFAMAA